VIGHLLALLAFIAGTALLLIIGAWIGLDGS
jgi:hypothetical protein